MLTRVLALELAPDIQVNSVAGTVPFPGLFFGIQRCDFEKYTDGPGWLTG